MVVSTRQSLYGALSQEKSLCTGRKRRGLFVCLLVQRTKNMGGGSNAWPWTEGKKPILWDDAESSHRLMLTYPSNHSQTSRLRPSLTRFSSWSKLPRFSPSLTLTDLRRNSGCVARKCAFRISITRLTMLSRFLAFLFFFLLQVYIVQSTLFLVYFRILLCTRSWLILLVQETFFSLEHFKLIRV